ncbi:MAG: dTMP kinase [Spirochaetia bacterium]|jgi:dTMP kinase|nr:dTMP kinase [Spirochaetia bacterium]
MAKAGYFIAFEGIDGSGKSTQVSLLASRLRDRDIQCAALAEPSDGAYGLEIRKMLSGGNPPGALRQMELFMLDRADDAEKNIAPALAAGKTVIIDRYYFSNAAYQGAMGLDYAFILEENRKRAFPEPDKVFLIDLSPDTAIERIAGRANGARDIFEKKEFLAKVRDIFFKVLDGRFVVIDGNQAAGKIHQDILKNLDFAL